uniref:Matrilin 1 n=1 Tax=Oryctolagus cuniculus TaxID=9986 RepID=A0A5F9C4D6_RABIT
MAPHVAAVRQTCCCFNVRVATTALAIYHVIMSVLLFIEHSVEVAQGKASCRTSKAGYLRIADLISSFLLITMLFAISLSLLIGVVKNREKYLLPFLSLQIMDFLLCLLTLLGSYIELPAYLKFASRSRTGPSKVPLMTLQLLDFCLSILTLCSSYMEVPTYLNFKSMNHMNYLPSQEGMARSQFIKMMIIFSVAFITVLILKVYMFKCVWRCYRLMKCVNLAERRSDSKVPPKVVIVVTDGRPQDSVRDVSERARASGVELFAIGVGGRVDKATLRQIASEPQDEHVDYVESYSVIEKLSKKFREAFCVVSDLCATGDHDCEQVCVSSPGSYTCACRDGFTLNSDGKTCNVCSGGGGSSATDLVFLIDGSKSVRPENFELVKKFINQIVDTLDVSDRLAQVGLVQYSSSVRQEFPLGRFHTKKDIKAAVRNMSYMEKGTMTGAALKYLIDNSFTVSSGARPGAQKVGIVFTDGRSQDYINDAAKKAKDLGFKMFAVGVGNAVEDELREIASEPVAEHYFYTADFKTITQIGKKLQKRICVEEDPCACQSIMKFQATVDGLLQALTRKLEVVSKRLAVLENRIV